MFGTCTEDRLLTDAESPPTRDLGRSGQPEIADGIIQALLLGNDLYGRAHVAQMLDGAGCSVTLAQTAAQALELLGILAFDVIVVDIRPDLLGCEALSVLRAARVSLPLLFISARSAPDAVRHARALGADDVAVLPFDGEAVKACIASLTRRPHPTASRRLRAGRLELDPERHQASVGADCLTLTEAEFAILELLVISGGAPVGIARLMGGLKRIVRECDEKTVRRLIARLRRKLLSLRADTLIVTVRGLGLALRGHSCIEHP